MAASPVQEETQGANRREKWLGELALAGHQPSFLPLAAEPLVLCQLFSPGSFWHRWPDRHVRREGDRAALGSPVPAASPCATEVAPGGSARSRGGWPRGHHVQPPSGTDRDGIAAAGSPSPWHLLNNPSDKLLIVCSFPCFCADSSRLLGSQRPGYGTLQRDADKAHMVGPRASPRGGRGVGEGLGVSQPQSCLVVTCLVLNPAKRLWAFISSGFRCLVILISVYFTNQRPRKGDLLSSRRSRATRPGRGGWLCATRAPC